MIIKWPVEAIIVQKNKSCFYSHFITESPDGFVEQRQYRCGDIIFIKVDRRMPPLLAEITHLWVCKNLKGDDDDGKIRIRLFSRPEDTPHGRSHHHGEHELLMFHKPAVMTCKQFLSLEQTDVQWNIGIPLQPQHDAPSSPSSLLSSNSSTTALLYCNETMMPVGGFEDQTGASPTTSPVITRSPPPLQYKIRIISFSAYCRYRAVLKRFETQPFEFMDLPLVQAMGGIAIPQVPTLTVFCHKTFRDICLERKISLLEGNSSLDMVTFKTDSLVDSSQHVGSGRGHLPKRKRGRPRKTELSGQQSQSNALPLKRKRGRPRKNPLCETTPTTCTTSDITESTLLSTPSTFNSDCQTNGVVFCSNDPLQQDDNKTTEVSLMFPAKPFIAGPAELVVEESIVHKYNGCHQNDMLTLLTTQSNSDISDTNSSDISSISPTNKSHPLISSHLFSNAAVPHSLRPRSTLQPPSQFRDIYDIESAQVIVTENKTKVQQSQVIPRQYKAKIDRLTNPLSTQDLSPNETVLTSSTISLDVKQLLRAHLSQTQTSIAGEITWTHSTLENLESHLLEEKNFLDLLFCFMKMRNTPIHRIPRLGSKYLNLYELFKATSNYGGYDQVTLNRKWSSVFDSMGYSTGMTCASTVTRRHYEKLLLPFEKALTAMKENTSCTV